MIRQISLVFQGRAEQTVNMDAYESPEDGRINDVIMPIGIGCGIVAIILIMGILIVKFALC